VEAEHTAQSVPEPVVRLGDVGVRFDDRWVLESVNLIVAPAEHWVVLGPNGCGKTTLVQVLSLYRHPTRGTVEVLGQRLGRMDVRSMRTRIGVASSAVAGQLRPELSALDVVMTAKHAALEPWWHRYDDDDRRRALVLLEQVKCGAFAARAWGTLSSGERQRVLLARTLMADPAVLLLDEPTAGLDLAGREEFMGSLVALAAGGPPSVLVTHHLEEIPPTATHALLLRAGRTVAQGPIETTLTEASLSAALGLDLVVERFGRRWAARAR
jgi:iron complex transport system ATP-binding protein